jgi:ketosteroid isomerase-like protein
MSTESVIKHHLKALADGDLEETMKDYADSCVFIGGNGVIDGKDGIREVFRGALANGPFVVALEKEHYHEDVGFITWSVPGVIALGTDTFIVEDGLIVLQTNALSMTG